LQRSWGGAKFASTRSTRAWSKPKARRPRGSPPPTAPSASRSRRKRRSGGSASPGTSHRPPSTWRRTIPAGSPARRCTSPAGSGNKRRPQHERATAGERVVKDNRAVNPDPEDRLELFAAELAAAAYPVALRHGLRDEWLDLELDLWRVLGETVKKYMREQPRTGRPGNSRLPPSQ